MAPALAQSYRCVVADARTRAALPAATVQAAGRTLRTDEAGRFELPARPAQLQLSHVGYQPRQWQPAPAADTLWLTPQAVALPNVRVRAQPRQLVWRAPGKARWPYDAFANSLTPTEQVAMLYRPADATRSYRIRAVRLRLGSRAPQGPADLLRDLRRFPEGRLQVQLLAPGPDGAPATALLPASWEITPALSEEHEGGWLRLPVADAELRLPAAGVFIVANGLTGSAAETFVRNRTLLYRKHNPTAAPEFDPQKLKGSAPSTRVNSYVEVQPAATEATRLVLRHEFPALAQLTAPSFGACYAWAYRAGRWQSVVAYYQDLKSRFPKREFTPYNYELELEVEEL
ncbi:hypothetical protein [Hymenobacter edaphi]|uniref:Carboxypeptidase-like regulatory domain-containing protein n=1 Tax=Hymenobacter edaphi TaxID=2211146 RepID=A0A328BAA5_9BACT|nr:hypothetical protein [Hymenobacter edaphi]RAK63917.1 hypothetical protein DLM85_20440 [Hymenobacter edaphi]